MALPQAVDAERHEVVHQVVAAGDGGEHLADELLLVGDGDVAEAEMGGLGLVAHSLMVADRGLGLLLWGCQGSSWLPFPLWGTWGVAMGGCGFDERGEGWERSWVSPQGFIL